MTPQALATIRDLQSLGLSIEIQRKVSIAADGRPCFTALSDPEFDEVLREVRRRWPDYRDLAREAPTPAQGGG